MKRPTPGRRRPGRVGHRHAVGAARDPDHPRARRVDGARAFREKPGHVTVAEDGQVGRAHVALRLALRTGQRARDDVHHRRGGHRAPRRARRQARAAEICASRCAARSAARAPSRSSARAGTRPGSRRPSRRRRAPSRRKTTRSAQAACRASWVTSTPAAPASQRARSSRRTSSPVSLSSAPVGSSASISRRVADERAGDRDPLLLAAGHLVGEAVGELADADLLERGQCGLRGAGARRTPSSSRGSATFSAAVSAGIRLKSWKT